MKKIVSPLIALLLVFSCSKDYSSSEKYSVEEGIEPELSSAYFNSILTSNQINNAYAQSVENLNETDSQKLSKYYKNIELKEDINYEEGISVDLALEGEEVTFHILPQSDFSAYVFIEKEDGTYEDAILMNIDSFGEMSAQVSWVTDKSINFTSKESECEEGASDVQDVGGAVAFLGFFGCAPCPFVGGAIYTVATVLKFFCPDDDEEE